MVDGDWIWERNLEVLSLHRPRTPSHRLLHPDSGRRKHHRRKQSTLRWLSQAALQLQSTRLHWLYRQCLPQWSQRKDTDETGTAASGYDYAASTDSTQTHAIVGDFLPTSTTAVQARLYESRYDSNSYSNPINADNSLGPQFDYGNLYERYHRADATVSQQIGSWQFLQGATSGYRIPTPRPEPHRRQ